ncbi:YaaR family protein [bacterium]|nr:YaaR family protein [bacterium]
MQINTLVYETNMVSDRISKKTTVEEMDEFNNNLCFPIKPSLNILLSRISDQSKILLESPIYDNLVKYKDMVKEFMQEVVSELYVLKKHTTSQSTVQKTGQKNMYFSIEKVNENLIALTEDVLRKQSKSLVLASRLNLIHGLLMDMYV